MSGDRSIHLDKRKNLINLSAKIELDKFDEWI